MKAYRLQKKDVIEHEVYGRSEIIRLIPHDEEGHIDATLKTDQGLRGVRFVFGEDVPLSS